MEAEAEAARYIRFLVLTFVTNKNTTILCCCRLAAEEQERRDYELAMRLAQVNYWCCK